MRTPSTREVTRQTLTNPVARGAADTSSPGAVGGPHLSVAKPIRAIRLLPGGRCGCTGCLADEERDNEQRDKALTAVVYQLGVEQLRVAALNRVPEFQAACGG